MAEKKITFLSLLKTYFQKPHRIQNYLLMTLTFFTFGAITTYLNYTAYSFIGIIILIMILLPFVVTFIEYTGRMEAGLGQTPTPKSIYFLFANTYKSGRVRLLFSWKTAILFMLYLILGGMLFTVGMGLYLYFFDPSVYNAILNLVEVFQAANSPEALNALYDDFFSLIANYNDVILLVNQIILMAGIIYVVNRSMFNIYLTMFIEHRPNTPLNTILDAVFDDKQAIKKLRIYQLLVTLLALILYSALFIGAYTLFVNLNSAANVMLQAELVGLVALALLLPITARLNFVLYRELVNPNKERILHYIIAELKEILKSPGIPEETRVIITQLLIMREAELKNGKDPQPDENQSTNNES